MQQTAGRENTEAETKMVDNSCRTYLQICYYANPCLMSFRLVRNLSLFSEGFPTHPYQVRGCRNDSLKERSYLKIGSRQDKQNKIDVLPPAYYLLSTDY